MKREDFIKKRRWGKEYISVYKEISLRSYIKSDVIKTIGKKRKITYLDIGCGNGKRTIYFTEFLTDLGYDVDTYGADLNEKNLKKAEQAGVKPIYIDFERNELPIKADVITAFEVIEHIYDTDNFIRNVKSSLTKGGTLLMSTPNTVSWKNRIAMLFGVAPLNLEVSLNGYFGLKFLKHYYFHLKPAGHIRGFTPLSLKEFLEKNGFKTIKVWGIENWKVTRLLDFVPMFSTNFLVIAKRET
ncbi:class I SAM-dependent methyltransferase [Desulfonauticus submarinus]